MSYKFEWQHIGVLLVVLLVVFAVGCGGGGKKHSTGVGFVPTGDSSTTTQGTSGSREVSIVTPPEGFSDLSVLPPRLQELFNQPIWNMPIAPPADNVMTPPDPPEFIIGEAVEHARSLEFKPRGLGDVRTASYVDDQDFGFMERGLLDDGEVSDRSAIGYNGDQDSDGYDDVIKNYSGEVLSNGWNWVSIGYASPTNSYWRDTVEHAMFQQFGAELSELVELAYGDVTADPTGRVPGKMGGYIAGDNLGHNFFRWNLETGLQEDGQPAFTWYDQFVAPTDDPTAVSNDEEGIVTTGYVQNFIQGIVNTAKGTDYDTNMFVTLWESDHDTIQEWIDSSKFSLANNGTDADKAFIAVPVLGAIASAYKEMNPGDMDNPWTGWLGFPLEQMMDFGGGFMMLDENGPFRMFGQHFAHGFMWWYNYLDPAVNDRVFVYSYDGETTADGDGEYFLALPIPIQYGLNGPVGVIGVASKYAANPGQAINFHAITWGGYESDAGTGVYGDILWNFRDGTVGVGRDVIHFWLVMARYVVRVIVINDDDANIPITYPSLDPNVGVFDMQTILIGGGGGGPGPPVGALIVDEDLYDATNDESQAWADAFDELGVNYDELAADPSEADMSGSTVIWADGHGNDWPNPNANPDGSFSAQNSADLQAHTAAGDHLIISMFDVEDASEDYTGFNNMIGLSNAYWLNNMGRYFSGQPLDWVLYSPFNQPNVITTLFTAPHVPGLGAMWSPFPAFSYSISYLPDGQVYSNFWAGWHNGSYYHPPDGARVLHMGVNLTCHSAYAPSGSNAEFVENVLNTIDPDLLGGGGGAAGDFTPYNGEFELFSVTAHFIHPDGTFEGGDGRFGSAGYDEYEMGGLEGVGTVYHDLTTDPPESGWVYLSVVAHGAVDTDQADWKYVVNWRDADTSFFWSQPGHQTAVGSSGIDSREFFHDYEIGIAPGVSAMYLDYGGLDYPAAGENTGAVYDGTETWDHDGDGGAVTPEVPNPLYPDFGEDAGDSGITGRATAISVFMWDGQGVPFDFWDFETDGTVRNSDVGGVLVGINQTFAVDVEDDGSTFDPDYTPPIGVVFQWRIEILGVPTGIPPYTADFDLDWDGLISNFDSDVIIDETNTEYFDGAGYVALMASDFPLKPNDLIANYGGGTGTRFRTTADYPEDDGPAGEVSPAIRVTDNNGPGGGYDVYQWVDAFEILGGPKWLVVNDGNSAAATAMASDMTSIMGSAPDELNSSEVNGAILAKYDLVAWMGTYNNVSNTDAGYLIAYVNNGGNVLGVSSGHSYYFSGNQATYRQYLVGSNYYFYPYGQMNTSFWRTYVNGYPAGNGPGGNITNLTYSPATHYQGYLYYLYMQSGTTWWGKMGYYSGYPQWYAVITHRNYGSGEHVWVGLWWNQISGTAPSGPGRVGLLRNLLDDYTFDFGI